MKFNYIFVYYYCIVHCYFIDAVGIKNILTDYRRTNPVKFVFPNTKWCGPGDQATSFEDLGAERQTDMCCRQHDFCSDSIGAYETNETLQLTNLAGYSRLSCSCDDAFYNCLSKLSSFAATIVRNLYFSVIKTKCYKKDYPLHCTKSEGSLLKKCLEYSKNYNTEMVYQWVSLKNLHGR